MGCLFGKPKRAPLAQNQVSRDVGPLEIEDYPAFLARSKVEFEKNWMKPFTHSEKKEDFQEIDVLGGGTFGLVLLVKHKTSGEYYAMKCMEKAKIMRMKALERVREEKHILQSLRFNFTVRLNYFFMDNTHIHLVMPFIPGGELFRQLKKQNKFSEDVVKFYASQLVLALEYLHYLRVIYRDLKLENILIDRTGFLKVVDFGLSKKMTSVRTHTMCGTLEYMCPEMIQMRGYGFPADWWAFGILTYELIEGCPPFRGRAEAEISRKIVNNEWKVPWKFSKDLKDLLKNILQSDIAKRLGGFKRGVEEIKKHKWFGDVDWYAVLNRVVTPPFIPPYEEEGNTDNFSISSELWETPWMMLRKSHLNEFEAEFRDF